MLGGKLMRKELIGLSLMGMIIFQSFIMGNVLNNGKFQSISGVSLGYEINCKVCNGWQYTTGAKVAGFAKYSYTGKYNDTHHYLHIVCTGCSRDIGGGKEWMLPHSYENGVCKNCPKKQISDTTNMSIKVTKVDEFKNCAYRIQWPYHANYSMAYVAYSDKLHEWYKIYDLCGCVESGYVAHSFNSAGVCSYGGAGCGYLKTGNNDKVTNMEVTVTSYAVCSKCNTSHDSWRRCPPYCNNCKKYHKASAGCGNYCKSCGNYHHKDIPCSQWNEPVTSTGSVATNGVTIGVNPNYIPYGSIVIANSNNDKDNELSKQVFVAQDTGSLQDYKRGAAVGASSNHVDFYTDGNARENPWNLGDSNGNYGGAYVKYEVTVIKPDSNHNQHATTAIKQTNSDGTITVFVKCLVCSNNGGDIIINSYTYKP